MAHFAELDENNNVLRVIVVHNNELLDENNMEQESKGIEFCNSLFGGNWVKTSYNGTIRKNFASVGYRYDSHRDSFIPPKPYDSWILDEDTFRWVSPVPYPNDGRMYVWSEDILTWIVINETK